MTTPDFASLRQGYLLSGHKQNDAMPNLQSAASGKVFGRYTHLPVLRGMVAAGVEGSPGNRGYHGRRVAVAFSKVNKNGDADA